MQKLFLALAFLCFFPIAGNAQQIATKDASGNYHYKSKPPATIADLERNATKTEATYTDKNGVKYPVYLSASGKAFFIRTSKAGKVYRTYLKAD